MRRVVLFGLVVLTLALAAVSQRPGGAADHLEAPPIALDQPADISDVFAFVANGQVVLAMTVNPELSAGRRAFFDPNVLYQFKIDNTGDFREDLVIQCTFSRAGGVHVNQTMTLRGPDRPARKFVGASNRLLTSAPTGQLTVRLDDGVDTSTFVPTSLQGAIGQAWGGLIDDPFFFDLGAELALDLRPGSFVRREARDYHSGFNASAIAVAVAPSSLTGSGVPPPGGGAPDPNRINVWATTSRARVTTRSVRTSDTRNRPPFIQIDRSGKPSVSDFLIGLTHTASGPVANPAERLENKNRFNRGIPSTDLAEFGAEVRQELITRYKNSAQQAVAKVRFFLPDVAVLDTASTAGYPNGRRPGDDVVDRLLQFLTGDPKATDGVDRNDRSFEAVFPFLGLQHTPDEVVGPRG